LSSARSSFRAVIYSTLGDVYTELDEWESAVEAYETALRLDSNNHNAMNNYAYYLAIRGERIDYAQELALKAIRLEPENAAYLDTVGWIYYLKNEYDEAREYIEASIETGEASAEVYEHLGDVYDKLGEPEKAKKWWKRAFEDDSDREYLQNRLNP